MPIDLKLLIEPVSESSPCGEDLLFSADFDAIQHARRFDDPSLDQGEWVTDIKEADWSFVVARASALLGSQTKDLRLAVWLTEALAMEDGVPGLTQGYALVTGLCERYWEYLHPLPEGDDAEYRLGNVGWLVGRTAELLRAAPLTQTGDSSFSALDWEVATHAAQAAKRDPEHADDITRGKPAVEQIEASRRATPARFYVSLLAELRAFEDAMLGLERELDLRAGEVAPSFRKAKDAYESVYRLAERFAREAGVNPDAPDGQAARESKQDQAAGAQERTERHSRRRCRTRLPCPPHSLPHHRPRTCRTLRTPAFKTARRPWLNCARSRSISAAPNRTVRWPISRTRPPNGPTCRCTNGFRRS